MHVPSPGFPGNPNLLNKPGRHRAACPACAAVKARARDDALAIRVEPDGAAIWFCHRCGWRGRWGGSRDASPSAADWRRPKPRAVEPQAGNTNAARARAIWRDARPIRLGGLADRYLRGRGLEPPAGRWWPPTLREGLHRGSTGRAWPALIAAATRWPDRLPCAVQVTPLAQRRGEIVKAWIRPARLTFGELRGAAVRLAPFAPGRAVVLAEGVEDGLAVAVADPDAVPWAVLGAKNAANVVLPGGADAVLLLDGDDAGRAAAREAVASLWARGHRVRVATLPDGLDPNAALARRSA